MIETSYRQLEGFIKEAATLRQEVKPFLKRSIIYEGRYDEGKKSGKGDFLFPNGDFFRGNFDRDMKEGFGILISFSKNFVYKGDFKLDNVHGQGICLLSNGMVIEGYYNGVSSTFIIKIGRTTY
jgi:hypothetical protein